MGRKKKENIETAFCIEKQGVMPAWLSCSFINRAEICRMLYGKSTSTEQSRLLYKLKKNSFSFEEKEKLEEYRLSCIAFLDANKPYQIL
jgi:hypothetical protein